MYLKLTSLFLLLVFRLLGQENENLISDPSFEKYSTCPKDITGSPQNFVLKKWSSPTLGTPDYYNTCSIFFPASVPKNTNGYQAAYEGEGYIGITVSNQLCEYVQTRLLKPLIKDSTYLIQFYVNLSNYSGRVYRNLGMYLSNKEMNISTTEPLDVNPQLVSNQYYQDTLNWELFSEQYKAQGGERYVIIGFFPSSKKDFQKIKSKEKIKFRHCGRYNLDNVKVSLLLNSNSVSENNQKDTIEEKKDYINSKIFLPEICFETGKWDLSDEAKIILDALGKDLKQIDYLRIEISGHTDNTGNEKENIVLSEKRAQEVRNYLNFQGIELSKMKCVGYGSSLPVTSNDSEEGRAKNRRIEIIIL